MRQPLKASSNQCKVLIYRLLSLCRNLNVNLWLEIGRSTHFLIRPPYTLYAYIAPFDRRATDMSIEIGRQRSNIVGVKALIE